MDQQADKHETIIGQSSCLETLWFYGSRNAAVKRNIRAGRPDCSWTKQPSEVAALSVTPPPPPLPRHPTPPQKQCLRTVRQCLRTESQGHHAIDHMEDRQVGGRNTTCFERTVRMTGPSTTQTNIGAAPQETFWAEGQG